MTDSAANSGLTEVALEETLQHHLVNTQIFMPFLVARLMEHPATSENTLEYQIRLQDVGGAGMRLALVRWTWTQTLVPPRPLAAQREYITEAAAYALAFAALSRFTTTALVSVADRGDRYDYVLAENGVRCGVEVSGTQSEDLQMMRDRQAQKIRQLQANPKRWGGYVVIVGFALREIWISRHVPKDSTQ